MKISNLFFLINISRFIRLYLIDGRFNSVFISEVGSAIYNEELGINMLKKIENKSKYVTCKSLVRQIKLYKEWRKL